jgi:mannosyltransferase OCH1-like enzyme
MTKEMTSFHIPRSTEPAFTSAIPRTIYTFWHSRYLPKGMAEVIQRNAKANPEFETYIYSESEAMTFLVEHFPPEVVATYRGLKPSAYRSDLLRYCLLYAFGGVWLDPKMELQMPLAHLLPNQDTAVLKTREGYCGGHGVQNGFFATAPRSKILHEAIQEVVSSYQARNPGANDLDVTGPCMLGRVMDQMGVSRLRDDSRYESAEEGGRFVFYYNGVPFAHSYKEYLQDKARMQKEPAYKELWAKRDIYW